MKTAQHGARRRQRAIALRNEHNLSAVEISAALAGEGMPSRTTAVNRMLRAAGFPRLCRRTPAEREKARSEQAAAAADRKALKLWGIGRPPQVMTETLD